MINFFRALHYYDQGKCQRRKNLFSEESYRLGIDWLFYIIYRCNSSNDYSFPLLCNTEIEEIAIWEWGSDWLITVHVVAVHLMIIFPFGLHYCDERK